MHLTTKFPSDQNGYNWISDQTKLMRNFRGFKAVGAYVAGVAWQDGAGSTFTFVLGAGCALLSMVLALSLPKKIQPAG